MNANRRDRLVSWMLGAIAGISMGISIIDVLGIAPGWAAKLTPFFVGSMLLYVVLERERVDSVKYIVRRLDRGVERLRTQLRKNAAQRASRTGSAGGSTSGRYREIPYKGMIFRSNSEIKIAKALDHAGILFLPPTKARMTHGKERESREIDFVIFHEGRWGILEVDGPFHHSGADAQRDETLRRNGITVIERFTSDECYDNPAGVVRAFLARLGGDVGAPVPALNIPLDDPRAQT